MVENEKGEKKRTATEGLLWLLRGLEFTCKALQNAQADNAKELSVAFTESYGATLKQFHNFVVKGIFSVRRLWTSLLISLFTVTIGGHEVLPIPEGLLRETDL